MKDLKASMWEELSKGFEEVNNLLDFYKHGIDNLKVKEDQIEILVDNHMNTLRSFCDSHFAKIHQNLMMEIKSWRKRKEEGKED